MIHQSAIVQSTNLFEFVARINKQFLVLKELKKETTCTLLRLRILSCLKNFWLNFTIPGHFIDMFKSCSRSPAVFIFFILPLLSGRVFWSCSEFFAESTNLCTFVLAGFSHWIMLLPIHCIIDIRTHSSWMIGIKLPCWHIAHRLITRGQNGSIKRMYTGSLLFFPPPPPQLNFCLCPIPHLGVCSQGISGE